MLIIATGVVCFLFAAFVFFDLLSLMPRLSGSHLKMNGLGFSFQTIINTIKRIFLVLIPPSVGVIALNGTVSDVFYAIYLAHAATIASFTLAYVLRDVFFRYFCKMIVQYSQGESLRKSAILAIRREHSISGLAQIKFNRENVRFELLPVIVWIFFFYASSGFIINIIASVLPEYSVIVLQMTGFFNALGTMALAFYLDPKISRIYESGRDVKSVYVTLFVGQMINILIASPIFYGSMAALSIFLGQ